MDRNGMYGFRKVWKLCGAMFGLFYSFYQFRLQNEDNVDPYLAVYDPPLSFHVGDLLHVRWTGLLHPTFINQVLDLTL